MSYYVRRSGHVQRNSKPRVKQSVHKPNGVISSGVQKVGGGHFAIVCVDPAKHRSEWMMADYFGNLLIEPQTLKHQSVFFKVAVEMIRQAQQQHLHLAMPGYAGLFDRLFELPTALMIAARCDSPAGLVKLGRAGLSRPLRKNKVRHQLRTIDKVLAWAAQAADDPIQDGPMHHAIRTDLYELYQHLQRQIAALERQLASDLVQTPYVRLMAIAGINVVSAAELAGEMGPISQYANAITGRAGLFPSRYQSDQTDNDRGALIRHSIRRLRCVLMRIADNLACHCHYYRGQAEVDNARGVGKRASRVKIAKRFSRLALACVAGDLFGVSAPQYASQFVTQDETVPNQYREVPR